MIPYDRWGHYRPRLDSTDISLQFRIRRPKLITRTSLFPETISQTGIFLELHGLCNLCVLVRCRRLKLRDLEPREKQGCHHFREHPHMQDNQDEILQVRTYNDVTVECGSSFWHFGPKCWIVFFTLPKKPREQNIPAEPEVGPDAPDARLVHDQGISLAIWQEFIFILTAHFFLKAQRERLKRDRDKLVAQLNSLAFKAKAKRFKKFKDLRKERKKSKEGRRWNLDARKETILWFEF